MFIHLKMLPKLIVTVKHHVYSLPINSRKTTTFTQGGTHRGGNTGEHFLKREQQGELTWLEKALAIMEI